jgi:hypothetical protein
MMAGAHYASAAPAGVARASSVASSSPATTARALRRLAQGATARRAPPCRPAPIDALAFSARATGGFGGARFGHAGGRDALPQGRKLMQSSAMAQPRELVDDDGVDDTGGPTRIQRFNGNELDITVSNNGYSRRAYFSGASPTLLVLALRSFARSTRRERSPAAIDRRSSIVDRRARQPAR